MEIRRLRAGEGLAYRAVRLRALEREPAAYGQTLAEALADPEQVWHDLAAAVASDGPRAMFVIDGGDANLVGTLYAALSETPPHLGELGAMWVDPDLRAQGWADALLETAQAWTARWGAPGLALWVAGGNERAWRFYARHGFQPTGGVERWEGGEAMELYCPL